MLELFSQQDSGNCYKVRLMLAHLGLPFRLQDINTNDGSTRSKDYLALNPNGKVPLLRLDDGRTLAESNAILAYLGEGTRFLSNDRYDRAKTMEWLFFEQYSHEPAIAVRRSLLIYPERAAEATPTRMAHLLEAGKQALRVMERRLDEARWLAGGEISIADIGLYAYTHLASEAGFDLAETPAITAWLDRVRSAPGHQPIDWRPQDD